MVRETRYLWIGNLPDKASEEDLTEHFQRYGKIQSVKFLSDDDGRAAVVAFMDIKSASKAHSTENKIGGKVVETQYTEASGKGSKVTRTAFEKEAVAATKVQPPSRYDGANAGYEGYGYGSFYSSGGGSSSREEVGERWAGGPGDSEYYSAPPQQQDRGRARQRYPPPQAPPPQPPYKPAGYSQHKQFDGHYGAYDKYGGPRAKAGQSPGKPEALTPRPTGKPVPRGYADSRSRSRSSSSSSSDSHSTSTSRSRRSSSKTSKERKRSSVVIPMRKKDEGADKLGLLLRGFPPRSSDTSIRDGLFHEYKKCGKVMSVSITGEKENRFAIVTFKKVEDASKALEQARAKVFFGRKVTAEAHDGVDDSEADYRPPEAELDEYHHKATRTLFVGNLQLDISKETLKEIFRRYGLILDVDIKNQQPNQVFAFVQFDNIKSVVHALHEMDGETVGNSKVKLGFGRSMPTNVLWVDNVTEQVQESYLKRQFCRVGPVNYVLIDRETSRALVFYDSNELALASLAAMRGRALASKKIQIDFASTQCMNVLMDNMEATGQLRPEDRPDQKGFRQYPPPTAGGGSGGVASSAAETISYEERPGYERSKGFYYEGSGAYRGRGSTKFRGQYVTRGGRTYQTGYDENYKGKRYEEGYEEEGAPSSAKYEDYDRELREYGHKQKERSDVDSDSPPYSRRTDDYKDDPAVADNSRSLKDLDNLDKESTASLRSDNNKKHDGGKSYEDKYEDKKREKVVRGRHSPSSEYSHRVSTSQRSPSSSPLDRSRRTSRDVPRAYSPSSPSRHSSPELASPKKQKLPSTTLISEIQRTRPRKHSLKRESESDLSELDKALQREGLFGPPKKRAAREENMDSKSRCDNNEAQSMDYRKKLECEQSARKTLSGSHSMDYSGAIVDNYRDRTKNNSNPPNSVQYDSRASLHYVEPPEVESKFSTPSPSTKSTKSESDKTPDSSERHSAVSSHSSGDMARLEQEKQRLLSELQDMEEGSVSDGEIRDDDANAKSKSKKQRLGEVFDLDWPEMTMKEWREDAIRREKQQTCDGQENKEPPTRPKNSHTEPPPKPPEPPGADSATTTSGASGKFKPLIDTKKSFRKQMEAMRKEHEQDTASRRHSQDSQESCRRTPLGGSMDIEMAENSSLDSGSNAGKTPRHEDFKAKKADRSTALATSSGNSSDFPKVKGQRSYRTTCTDEMAFGNEDRDGQKTMSRDKSEEQKTSRRYSDMDKNMGKSPSVNRNEESTDKDNHSSSRRSSRENTTDRKESHSSRRDRSGGESSSKKTHHRDLRSEPCVIPEFPVSKGKDWILHDPRKNNREKRRDSSPMSLPLPKFSKYVKKGVSPKRHSSSSRSHSSPKGQDPPQTPVSSGSKMVSPLFSPDMSPGSRVSRRDSYERSSSAKTPPYIGKMEKKSETLVKGVSLLDKGREQRESVEKKIVSNLDESTSTGLSMDITVESRAVDNLDQSESTVALKCSTELDIQKHSLSLEETCSKSEECSSGEVKPVPMDISVNIEKEIKKELENIDNESVTVPNSSELTSSVPSIVKDLPVETIKQEPVCNISKDTESKSNVSDNKLNIKLENAERKVECVSEESTSVSADSSSQIDNTTGSETKQPDEQIIVQEFATEKQECPTTADTATKSVAITSPASAEKKGSDSDLSDQDSAANLPSFDECIRALDEKLEHVSSSLDMRRTPSDSPLNPSTPTLASVPYRERFKVRKRIDSNTTGAATISSASSNTENKGQHSDIVRSLLSRSSIFDQDTKRLEQIDEKYQPKEYNLNLDRPTGTVGVTSDHEDELSSSSLESRVKDLYGLPQPKMPQFPSSILRGGAIGDGNSHVFSPGARGALSIDDEMANDGFGLGPSLTLTPPGSSTNSQDLANKFGPQTLSRYPFLNKKTASLDLSKSSPPPTAPPEGLRSPPIFPRDPRRDPTSPPVMVPLSLLRKTPPHSQTMSQSGGPSPLTSPTGGILKKSEPGPSILKKSNEPTTPPTSILKKTGSSDQLTSAADGFTSPPPSSRKVDERAASLLHHNNDRVIESTDANGATTASHKTSSMTSHHDNNSDTNTNTQTPSGTGKTTAVASCNNIDPENSALSKNEFCSGDGVQYQSTPSPPVLTKEVKEVPSQGIGTLTQSRTPLKRTASQAFLDKTADKDESLEEQSPPTLTEPLQLVELKINEETDESMDGKIPSPTVSEPEAKKQKISIETKDAVFAEKSKEDSKKSSLTTKSVKPQDKKNVTTSTKKGPVSSDDKNEKKVVLDSNKKGSTNKPVIEGIKKKNPLDNDKKSMLKKALDSDKKGDPRTGGKDTEKRLTEKKTDERKVSEASRKDTGLSSKKNDFVKSGTSERKDKVGFTDKKETSEKKVSDTDRRSEDSKKAVSPSDGKKGATHSDRKSVDKTTSDDRKPGDKVQDKSSTLERKTSEKLHSGVNSEKGSDKKMTERTQDKPSSNHKGFDGSDKKTDRKLPEVSSERKNLETDKVTKKSSSEKKSSPHDKKSDNRSGIFEKSSSNDRKMSVDNRKVKNDGDKKFKSQPLISATMDIKTADKTSDKSNKKLDVKSKESSFKSSEKSKHVFETSSSADAKQSQSQKEQRPPKDSSKAVVKETSKATVKQESQKSDKKSSPVGNSSNSGHNDLNKNGKGSASNTTQNDVKTSSNKNVSGNIESKSKSNSSNNQAEMKTKSGSNNAYQNEVKGKAEVKSKSNNSHQVEVKNKHKSEMSVPNSSTNKESKTDGKGGAVNKSLTGSKPKVKSESKSPTVTKTADKVNKLAEVVKEEVNDKPAKCVKSTDKVVKSEQKLSEHKKDRFEKFDKIRSDRNDRINSTSTKSEKYGKYRDINKNREKNISKELKKQEFYKVEEKSRSDVWKESMENKIMKDSSREKQRDDKRRVKHEMKEQSKNNHHHHHHHDRRHKSRGDETMDEKKVSPPTTSPCERKRSSSSTGETRELKQLRESLGIPADEPLQFTSMYDMVKRRTHREVPKDEVFSPEKQDKKRRGSYGSSGSDSDENSEDSDFSSENKENKKNQNKHQMKSKTMIMSSSSEEFSSDDSTKPPVLIQKTSPVSPKSKNQRQRRRKSVATGSSSQSSDSSTDGSDSDVSIRKTPTHSLIKRRPKVIITDSDSVDSDHETVQQSKPLSVANKSENRSKVSPKTVDEKKRPVLKSKRAQSSSVESSSDSNDSDDNKLKRKAHQTVLEKLEESIRPSSEESASSDSSDSSVAPTPKPIAGKPSAKKGNAKHFLDSDDASVAKKKHGVKSQRSRKVIAMSNSNSDSEQSSASDRDSVNWSKKVKPQSSKTIHKEVNVEQTKSRKETQMIPKPKKQHSPSVSQECHTRLDNGKSDQVKKSPIRKHSPKGLRVDTDVKKEVNKGKAILSPKARDTKTSVVQEKVKNSNKESKEVPGVTEQQENQRFSGKFQDSDSKSLKEDSDTNLADNAEDLNSSNVSDLTEEEKGREEKVNKMQSIFSKSESVFEKLDFDTDSIAKASSDGELDHTETEKVELSPIDSDGSAADVLAKYQSEKEMPKIDLQISKNVLASSKLFETSDSESEAEFKQIAEKILVGGDDSQDSEILDHVPLLEPEKVKETIVKPATEVKKTECVKKKGEVQTSEPVKNTVVETEKAVNSLVTLLEEVPAPTINETGIVENVEIITEPVDEDEEEKEERVDQVAQDEVASAILSISKMCGGLPLEENEAVAAIIQEPNLGASVDHTNQDNNGQIVYEMQQPENNSEAEQAVAALVMDYGFGGKPEEENYTPIQAEEVAPEVCPASTEQPQDAPGLVQEEGAQVSSQISSDDTTATVVTEQHSEGKEILQSIIDEINIVPSEKETPVPPVKEELRVVAKELDHKVEKPESDIPMVNQVKTKPLEVKKEDKPPKLSPTETALKSPNFSGILQDNTPVGNMKKQEEKPTVEKPTNKKSSVAQKPSRRHHEGYLPAVSSFEKLFPSIRNETRTKSKETPQVKPKELFNVITPQSMSQSVAHLSAPAQNIPTKNDYPPKSIPATKGTFSTDMTGNVSIPPLYNHSQHTPPDLFNHNEKTVMNGPRMPRNDSLYPQKPEYSPNSMFHPQRGQHLISNPLFQPREVQFSNRPRLSFQPQPKTMDSRHPFQPQPKTMESGHPFQPQPKTMDSRPPFQPQPKTMDSGHPFQPQPKTMDSGHPFQPQPKTVDSGHPFQPQPKTVDSGFFAKPGMKPPQQSTNNYIGMDHMQLQQDNNPLFTDQKKNIPPENKMGNVPFYNQRGNFQEEKLGNAPFFRQSAKDEKLSSPPFYGKKTTAQEQGNSQLYGQKPGFPPASEPYQHLIVKPAVEHASQHSSSRQTEPSRGPYSQQSVEKKRQNYAAHNLYEKPPPLQNSLYETQKERYPMNKTNYPQLNSQAGAAKQKLSPEEKKPEKLHTIQSDKQEKGAQKTVPLSSEVVTSPVKTLPSSTACETLLPNIKIEQSTGVIKAQTAENVDVKLEKPLVSPRVKQEKQGGNLQTFENITKSVDKYNCGAEETVSDDKSMIPGNDNSASKVKSENKTYEPKTKVILAELADTAPVKQSGMKDEATLPEKKEEPSLDEKTVDYMLPSNSVQESDTDREKDEDEEAKDNIQYEREPANECISIEGLNDFEDEEDLPDLIIDESPLPRISADDDNEIKKTPGIVDNQKIEDKGTENKDISVPQKAQVQPSQEVEKESKGFEKSQLLADSRKDNGTDLSTPQRPQAATEVTEVSLNVGEELEGGVLHIAEIETGNVAQPKMSYAAVNMLDNPTCQSKPTTRKMRVKGKKNHNVVRKAEAVNTGPLLVETSTPRHVQPLLGDESLPAQPVAQQKSPMTRGKSKQEEPLPENQQTTPPSAKKRLESAESPGKFSSRGRKIFPKERGDEIMDVKRKSRRSASTGSAASDETKVKTKTRTGSATPGGGAASTENTTAGSAIDLSGEVLANKKTWSLRSKKEAEVQEIEASKETVETAPVVTTESTVNTPPKEAKEEQKEPPIKITLRRTVRRKTMAQKSTTQEDAIAGAEVAEYTKVSEDQKVIEQDEVAVASENMEEQTPTVEPNHRPKRHRKVKGKKGAECAAGPATRTRRNDGSSSPRSKSTEGSPNNIAKSYVKLEKLSVDASKREEEDQKDLYEWEDEEEKPLPGYKVTRNTRKRKGDSNNDKGNSETSSQKPGGEHHPKRSKRVKEGAKKEAKQTSEIKEVPAEPVPVSKPVELPPQEKKEPAPEPRKPDMNDILQDKRGHLPLKLAMKLKSQEAARKENEAKEAAEKAAREQAEQQNAQRLGKLGSTESDPSFEKSEEARIIDKKRGRFISRDEQFSPGVVKDLSRAGTSMPAQSSASVITSSHSNRPPSVSTSVTSSELPSPKVISPATTGSNLVADSRPPSAPSTATVISSRAFGANPGDRKQAQKMREDVVVATAAHSRPSSQPSGATKVSSPKQKGSTGQKAGESARHPHVSIAGAAVIQPPHMLSQSLHTNPQPLSPHSMGGPSPRMPPPHLAAAGFSHHPGAFLSGLPQTSSSSPPSTTTSHQASELRAALAQPSKLVQQEQQLLQQQHQRHQLPQHSPHLPEASKGSPSLPGLAPPPHCIPFSIAGDQQARTETGGKVSTRDGVRPQDLSATTFRPELVALAAQHQRDAALRNGGLPQQMMIPGMPPMFIPGMPHMDMPRMLQHHELMAAQAQVAQHAAQQQQQQMLGMLPPHALLGQHQPPVADRHPHDQSSSVAGASLSGRPPSRHHTPPTSQPSPRGIPSHHPQVSTPLTPQLPQPPMAALPGRPPMAHMSNGIPSDGMALALQRFPVMWQGYLYLKNDASNVQMHFITGSKQLVTGALESVVEGGIVRIAQRMRLEASQLDGVAKRMQKEEEYSMLVAIPCGKDHVDIMHQSNKLQTGFIQYLQAKQAAGIVNIPVQPGYVVHIFPPCEFSSINITQKAPELVRNLNDNSYLVVVITST